jgi:hypothetical protein
MPLSDQLLDLQFRRTQNKINRAVVNVTSRRHPRAA